MLYFPIGQQIIKISSLNPTLLIRNPAYSNYFLSSPGTSNNRESTVYILQIWRRELINVDHWLSINKITKKTEVIFFGNKDKE